MLLGGVHEPIISEHTYWMVQSMLNDRGQQKTQPQDKFPLREVVKCQWGRWMTAGYSKGKTKYYLYYRCITHVEKNYPRELLHGQIEALLDQLSFSDSQMNYISEACQKFIATETSGGRKLLTHRKIQMQKIEKKMKRLNERLISDIIDDRTYTEMKAQYMAAKAALEDDVNGTTFNEINSRWSELKRLLPTLTNMKMIYEKTSVAGKHALIRGVFKQDLTYFEGQFRTPYVATIFDDNLLKVKEKGLIFFLDEPLSLETKVSIRSPKRANVKLFRGRFEKIGAVNSALKSN